MLRVPFSPSSGWLLPDGGQSHSRDRHIHAQRATPETDTFMLSRDRHIHAKQRQTATKIEAQSERGLICHARARPTAKMAAVFCKVYFEGLWPFLR